MFVVEVFSWPKTVKLHGESRLYNGTGDVTCLASLYTIRKTFRLGV